jgi:hypothetical protein
MPLNLSPFCVSLGFAWCGGFVVPANLSRLKAQEYFSRKGAKAQSAPAFPRFSLRLCAFAGEIPLGMVVANCSGELSGKEIDP